MRQITLAINTKLPHRASQGLIGVGVCFGVPITPLLFTSYSLAIHALFTNYSLAMHELFTSYLLDINELSITVAIRKLIIS